MNEQNKDRLLAMFLVLVFFGFLFILSLPIHKNTPKFKVGDCVQQTMPEREYWDKPNLTTTYIILAVGKKSYHSVALVKIGNKEYIDDSINLKFEYQEIFEVVLCTENLKRLSQ